MGASGELSQAATSILADIYRRFHDAGEWPLYHELLVDHPDLVPPAHDVIRELEREHLSVRRPVGPSSRCFLKLKALRVIGGAQEDLENLIAVSSHLARCYLDRRTDREAWLVDGEEMVSVLKLYPLAADRVFALLEKRLPQLTDLGGRDPTGKKWPDFRVRVHAHHFRDVATVEGFFAAVERSSDAFAADHAMSPGYEDLTRRVTLAKLGKSIGGGLIATSKDVYFISHAASDVQGAELVRGAITSAHSGEPEVFVSTRAGDIPGGEPWLNEIRARLDQSNRVVVLLTPVSIRRWWIWFEAGAAWLRDEKVMVPVLAGGLHPTEVPEPLRLLQLYSLEEPEQAVAAFQRLGLGLRSAGAFCAAVKDATADSRGRDWRSRGWEAIEVEGVWYVWGGSQDGLRSAPGNVAPPALMAALKDSDIDARFGLYQNLSNEESRGMAQLFAVSNDDVLRPLLHQGQVLLAMRSGT